uniref:Acrosin-binding protein n=1 Tax=Zonotrichia albicollis TaxID=44394 RepID=A0A8D2NCB7_ZONAL
SLGVLSGSLLKVIEMLLGWGCIAGPRGTKAQEPGTPLSDQEYHQFFQFLRITIQARTACELRELYGCKNSLIQRLDEYENHGAIPPGPICSELPENPSFLNFCTFSLYRCIMKQYFLKVSYLAVSCTLWCALGN